MDDIEREEIRADGLDPDDRAVVAAIDLVRWELSLYFGDQDRVPDGPKTPLPLGFEFAGKAAPDRLRSADSKRSSNRPRSRDGHGLDELTFVAAQ